MGARGDVWTDGLPADRRPAVPADARPAWVLLVPAEAGNVTLAERALAGERALLDEETLLGFVQRQRWFGAKSEDVAHATVLDTAVLRTESPLLVTALTEIRFHTGTHQTYQLLLGLRPQEEGWHDGVIAEAEGSVVYDALGDPELASELVLLRFLTERDFENIAALTGWYEYVGKPMDATLGVLQEYIPNGRDGWELALEELGTDPEAFLARLRRLGEVTGELHTVLGSDPADAEFCPEETSAEALA